MSWFTFWERKTESENKANMGSATIQNGQGNQSVTGILNFTITSDTVIKFVAGSGIVVAAGYFLYQKWIGAPRPNLPGPGHQVHGINMHIEHAPGAQQAGRDINNHGLRR